MNKNMDTPNEASQRIDYGLDAPGLVRFFFLAGSAVAIVAIAASIYWSGHLVWLIGLRLALGAVAIYLLGMGSLMLFWSTFTKVSGREKILDLVPWRGDELVLDVGCGRGLMLVGAARRLSTGQAVGVDIWETKDQSSNSAEAVLNNARMAGVQNRIEVQTADARTLPFPDQSFDIVLSHWVVHNLPNAEDRNRALSEMARVLRPKGRLIVSDIENRDAYMNFLQSLGLEDRKMMFGPLTDVILGAVSFGSFKPTTIIASKAI